MKPFVSTDDENPEIENFSAHAVGGRVCVTDTRRVFWTAFPQAEAQKFWEWLGVWLRMQGDRSEEKRCKTFAPDDVTRCVLVEHPASVDHFFEPLCPDDRFGALFPE